MRYVKKPIIVDAIQWLWLPVDEASLTEDNRAEIQAFVNDDGREIAVDPVTGELSFWCHKSTAWVTIAPGGWVIAEGDGIGHYPCTAERFDATYEPTLTDEDLDAAFIGAGPVMVAFALRAATLGELLTEIKERMGDLDLNLNPQATALYRTADAYLTTLPAGSLAGTRKDN